MVMSLLTRPKKTVATITVATDGSGDTTDIQTGINMLPATGGCVYIREGTYNITATITIPYDSICIIGCGRATILQGNTGGNVIYANNLVGISVENLRVTVGVTNPSTNGISYRLCTLSKIYHCWIDNLTANGINLITTISTCTLIGNQINNCGNNGIYLGTVSNTIINSNRIYSNTQSGIYIDGGWYIIINSNNIISNGFNGIHIVSADRITITGNNINENTRNGILLDDLVNNVVVSSNMVDANGIDGIQLVSGAFGYSACNRNIISENLFRLNVANGINIGGVKCNYNLILGNTCQTTLISDSGTNTQIFNNLET